MLALSLIDGRTGACVKRFHLMYPVDNRRRAAYIDTLRGYAHQHNIQGYIEELRPEKSRMRKHSIGFPVYAFETEQGDTE